MNQYSLGELTVDEFIKAVNKCRLENKNKWFGLICIVDGAIVRIKNYGTYLQIFTVNDVRQATPMEMKPTHWKEFIKQAIVNHK